MLHMTCYLEKGVASNDISGNIIVNLPNLTTNKENFIVCHSFEKGDVLQIKMKEIKTKKFYFLC